MTFKIYTLGCKVNTYESNVIKDSLVNHGYEEVEEDIADTYIINTCTVTDTSAHKSLKVIRQCIRKNQNAIIVVCGCMTQVEPEKAKIEGVSILLGNRYKSQIASYIEQYKKTKEAIYMVDDIMNCPFESMKLNNFNHTRAFVKIEDGCENYCSYCIIPYVRGSIRSKPFDEAVDEIKKLVLKGHKEIVFTGINTGAYGKETKEYNLTDLIQVISKIKQLERIRISSIEITEITDRFIEEMKNNPKLCGHLHVSLQSGSERILKLMNRKYTKQEYLDKINKLKKARPNINLTTDVIVGFPTETEEEFIECVEFCKLVGFSKIHVFPYSKREGTKAANMDGQISNDIKKDRARRLIKIDEELQLKYNQKFIGKTVNVLIEEIEKNMSIGHTENFLKVEINQTLEPNKTYTITINKIYNDKVIGKLD